MTSDFSAGAPDSRQALWLIFWSLALFTAVLVLDTRHNEFPYFYHPDEPTKVDQVMTSEWNYHHPMLLLSVTKAVVEILRIPSREQDIVEVGRWVSAAFTAVAVVAFALLAYAWRGWTASIGTGLALLLHHQLFELAHYMKEDPALLMGSALTYLTAYAFWFKPNAWRALLMGIAVALAISGKYVGVVALGIAVPVLLRAPGRGDRKRQWICFAGALAATLLVVNLPLLLHLSAFRQSLGREMDFVVHGQRGVTRNVPHAQYWGIFRDNSTPVMWVLLVVFLSARWRERRRLPLMIWLLIAFPFACTLALSFFPKSNDRYFLPASACFTLLAALGAVDAAKYLSRWMRYRWALAGTAAALVIAQIPSWMTYEAAFQRDDNAELLDWVKTQTPADAVIAKDSRVQLPDPGNPNDKTRFRPMPQKILSERYAADVGSIEKMRDMGVTFVAVSESDYGIFRLRSLRPQAEEAESFARRKEFYDNLLRDGELLFERERGTVLYLHPGIRVYRLPPKGN
jgi:hypothetical protein